MITMNQSLKKKIASQSMESCHTPYRSRGIPTRWNLIEPQNKKEAWIQRKRKPTLKNDQNTPISPQKGRRVLCSHELS